MWHSPISLWNPGQKDKCCGNYPERFPFASMDGNRGCCGGRTFDTSIMECCADGQLRFSFFSKKYLKLIKMIIRIPALRLYCHQMFNIVCFRSVGSCEGCACIHGSCSPFGGCVCEPGFHGPLCDIETCPGTGSHTKNNIHVTSKLREISL